MLRAILFGLFLYLLLRWAMRVLQVMGAVRMGQAAQRKADGGASRQKRGRIDLSRIEEADFEEIQDTKRDNDRS
jgi:hypothetical protein